MIVLMGDFEKRNAYGGESCTFELLVTQKCRRQIGPNAYPAQRDRASAEWQLSKLLRARDSE